MAAPTRELRKVTRSFQGAEGHVHKPGDIVDVSGWRHKVKLVEQHKLSDYIVTEGQET